MASGKGLYILQLQLRPKALQCNQPVGFAVGHTDNDKLNEYNWQEKSTSAT